MQVRDNTLNNNTTSTSRGRAKAVSETHPSCNNSNRVVYQTQIRRATGDRPNNVDTTAQNAKRLDGTPQSPPLRLPSQTSPPPTRNTLYILPVHTTCTYYLYFWLAPPQTMRCSAASSWYSLRICTSATGSSDAIAVSSPSEALLR